MTEELKRESSHDPRLTAMESDAVTVTSSMEASAGTEALAGQAGEAVVVNRPATGQTVEIRAAAGQTYILNFPPGEAQVQVQDDDFVLAFDDDGDGTPDSRIVFLDLATLIEEGNAPIFQVAGVPIGSGTLVTQALALAGQADTPLEDVAGGPVPGGGATQYSDNLGDIINLLVAQGVIPPVALQFGLIDLEDEIVLFEAEPENSPPLADPVLTPAGQGELPSDLEDALGPISEFVVFFKKLSIDGSIDDDDSGTTADFGGADAESSLENLVFTLQTSPTFGQLILVTAGGDTSFLTPGDPFSSGDTVWWIATEQQIADFLLQEGAPEFLPDVDFLYSVTDEDGASVTAPVTITLPPPSPPETALQVEEGDCLNEDTTGTLFFTADPTDAISKISQIVVSGFPTGGVVDAWVVDEASVSLFGYVPGVDYTASYDAASGTLTISLTTASFSVGETVSGTVGVTPNPDSDVDVNLNIAATAINGAGSATGDSDSVIAVDADADGAEGSSSDDGDGVHLSVAATIADSSGEEPENFTFQSGETGTLNITATFDDFLDGSETHTIVVKAPAGFTILGVDGALPPGVTLTDDVGSVWTFDVETLNGVGSLSFTLLVQNTGAEDGAAAFQVLAVAEETSTGDIECVEGGEGGIDPIAGDNVAFVEATAVATVTNVASPEVSLSLPQQVDCIEEDSGLDDAANLVTLTVTPVGDDEITEIVISGLQADWTYDFSGLETDGATLTDGDPSDGVITLSVPNLASYSGSFAVQPPADSDVDHPTITASATVTDPVDPALTATGDGDLDIYVDANADGGEGSSGDDGDGSHLSISIDDIADSDDAGDSFQSGESGTVTLTATFDDFLDGSETHSFTLTAPEGFEIDGINAASPPLPAGVTFDLAGDGGTITFFVPTDSVNGVGSLTVTLDITNVSAAEGSPLFEASATAVETTTGDMECDPSEADNVATVSDERSVTVAGIASPTVSINLENDTTFIKEDSLDNAVEFAAATGDASDELTTLVITFPAEVEVSHLDFSSVAADADVVSVDVDDNGGLGPVMVTITLVGGVTAFSGSFTLDAPKEDSDVDLGAISIVANVQDQVDNSQTDSANASLQIDVDAVLDEALDPGADSDVVETETAAPQTVNLGLAATLGSAGFVNDPPLGGDSGSGGIDDDGSELISVVLVLDNPLPAGVTLSSTAGTVTQDLGADPSGKTYVVTGANLADAIDGLQVELPGSFEGAITGTVIATSKEANTPPGDVAPASGEEPDTSDNVVVLSAAFSVTIQDGADPTGGTLALTVDEEALDLVQDGDDLAPGTTFGTNGAATAETDSGTLVFNAGADPIVDIRFAGTGGIVVQDEGGTPIPVVWSGAGSDTLTGTLNGVVVIVLALSGDNAAIAGGAANVTVTATLTDAFPHDFGNTGDVSIVGIIVAAEDDDGDVGTGTVSVTVVDDTPNDISPDPAVIGSNGAFPGIVTEDLGFFDNVGADKPGDVKFLASLDGTTLMDSGGNPVTTSGQPIMLAVSADGHKLTGYVESGLTPGFQEGEDTVFITVELNPNAADEGADEYTVTLFGHIDTGLEIAFDDFSGIGGGLNYFFPLQSSTNPGLMQDLLITGKIPGTSTVNTDSDDVGTGDQWLNNNTVPANGEIIRLDYVTDVGGDPHDISTLTYDTHYGVNDAGFRVNQLQGNKATTRTVLVRVYDDDDDPKGNDFIAGGQGDPGEQDDITQARITFFSGGIQREIVATANGTISMFGRSFTFDFSGSAVVIAGLLEGDQVYVSTVDGFNQLEVQNVTSGNNLGIALDNFLISTSQAGEPVDLSLNVEVMDEDGDTASGTIDVTILPQQNGTAGADTLLATAEGSDLVGGAGNDTLIGSDAGDKLQGGDDVDTISDGAGNDLILGGDGADIINLAADGDTDILVYDAVSELGDTVTGFDVSAPNIGGAGGDVIDLTDLLDSGSFEGTTLADAVAGGFVQLAQAGADTEVRVDLNGGGDSFVVVATLNAVLATDLSDNVVVD